ncbi:MAG: hypothetical protein RL199_1085 [Pseudomonadota bacterium]
MTTALHAKLLSSMAEVDASAWDAVVPARAKPFQAWAFLDLLERSGSAVAGRGWTPRHLTIWRGTRLVAAAPGWVKTHSMGEFFYNDFQWADHTPGFGVDYYPKYVVTVPFSPVPGPKLLVHPDEADPHGLRRALARFALEAAGALGCSSAAVLFADEADLAALADEGYARGAGMQFIWENRGYRSFDDFLAQFSSKRRHMLRSERAQLAKDGTVVRTLTGDELTPERMAFASRCYESTVERNGWNEPHLTPAFFREAPQALPGAVELVVAEEQGRGLGGAFNLRGTRLYGRHWGVLEDRRFLHFNVCYYHSIERAIAEGIEAFEPGAGGEHKLVRGFSPSLVHSAHAFVEPRLHGAMSHHLARTCKAYEEAVTRALEERTAFRSSRPEP